MFARVLKKEGLRQGVLLLGFAAAALWLLWRPQALANGISRGLSVCSGVIIPTLYPFMILAGLLTESPLCRSPGRIGAAVTRTLFGLPGCCGPAILISLVGGYPAGAIAIGRLRRQEQITTEQAQRMARFCVNGGPGFIIATVGSGLLGSVKAGVLLFAAHAAVSVLIGLWLAKGHRRESEIIGTAAVSPPRSVAATVGDTCTALLTMCGFVVLAAAVLSLLEASGIPLYLQQLTGVYASHISAAAAGLLEVSCGCIALAGTGEAAPFWLSLCMGWGGLSVQGQLMAAVDDRQVFGRGFRIGRLFHGAASGLLALLLFRLFPADLPTVGGQATALPFSVSADSSVMLLLLSFLAMLTFSSKKTGKTERDVL